MLQESASEATTHFGSAPCPEIAVCERWLLAPRWLTVRGGSLPWDCRLWEVELMLGSWPSSRGQWGWRHSHSMPEPSLSVPEPSLSVPEPSLSVPEPSEQCSGNSGQPTTMPHAGRDIEYQLPPRSAGVWKCWWHYSLRPMHQWILSTPRQTNYFTNVSFHGSILVESEWKLAQRVGQCAGSRPSGTKRATVLPKLLFTHYVCNCQHPSKNCSETTLEGQSTCNHFISSHLPPSTVSVTVTPSLLLLLVYV